MLDGMEAWDNCCFRLCKFGEERFKNVLAYRGAVKPNYKRISTEKVHANKSNDTRISIDKLTVNKSKDNRIFSDKLSVNKGTLGTLPDSISAKEISEVSAARLRIRRKNYKILSSERINQKLQVSSRRILTSSTYLSTILVNWIIMLASLSSAGTCVGQLLPSAADSMPCDLTNCWLLYQSARDSLGVPEDDFVSLAVTVPPPSSLQAPRPSPGGGSTPPANSTAICIALRTFRRCLLSFKVACLGDLSYHSLARGNERQMSVANCSADGEVYNGEIKSGGDRKSIKNRCTYQGGSEREDMHYCSAYPHLRTFSQSEHRICSIRGAWPMIDNQFLTVQVSTEEVSETARRVTAIKRVTILIRSYGDCTEEHYVLYQASGEYALPVSFEDGRTSFGFDDSVEIHQLFSSEADTLPYTSQERVLVTLRHAGTVVDIRRVGKYLSVSIQQPRDVESGTSGSNHRSKYDSRNVLEKETTHLGSLQLCFSGCPKQDQVDIPRFFFASAAPVKDTRQKGEGTSTKETSSDRGTRDDKPNRSRIGVPPWLAMDLNTAYAVCRTSKLVDSYLDSCVYDLSQTGDDSLRMLALFALEDAASVGMSLGSNRTILIHESSSGCKLVCAVYLCHLSVLLNLFIYLLLHVF